MHKKHLLFYNIFSMMIYQSGRGSILLLFYKLHQNLFQRNLIDRFTFLGIDQVGVNLGGGYVLVSQHLRDRIDVRARSDLQRSVGVAEAVERDVLLDTRRRNPFFQRIVYHTACKPFEYRAA